MNKNNTFTHVGIIGFGMVGGSICDLIAKSSPETKITLIEPNPDYREIAFDRHPNFAVDVDLSAITNCDLVIVANYVNDIAVTVCKVLEDEKFSGLVVDTGSVKESIIKEVLQKSQHADRFVPGHPMAGRNEPGPSTASADIMRDQTFLLCEHPNIRPGAIESVEVFLSLIGFKPHRVAARDHDAILSVSSHLPHILAYALAGQLDEVGLRTDSEDLDSLSGRSIRTMVDFASPNFAMWEDILLANKSSVLDEGRQLARRIEVILSAIATNDIEALKQYLNKGALGRQRVIK
jgi:prephenate dehydrogenase